MENEKFLTCLLMSSFGIILIFIAMCVFILSINSIIKSSSLEEAIPVMAEITYKMQKRDKNNIIRYTYSLKYEINGKEYKDEIETKDSKLNKGDKILVYYLKGSENRIYLSKENNTLKNILSFILTLVFIELPALFLGIKFIKNYNIFKYKRTIDVE